MDDKERRDVIPHCVFIRRAQEAFANRLGLSPPQFTRLFNSDVEDHVVELLNLDETPDAIKGCRKRLRMEFE